ncbi:hypothetical protein DFH06DRAFT_1151818 [Mycena polygramma]|nr:hypothetical protein DFH06DRAFT_1151818 [Mycena polygramma]
MPFPSSATTIVDLPDELVLDIFGRLPSEDAVSMLRVTPQLHFLAARVLYTNVRAAGLNGRRFFATLASKTARSTVYATFLRRLRYTFTSPSDAYLTYPVLCQALLTMNHLISLTLDVSASQADMLTLCLQRYGLLRTRILLGARLLATAQGRQTPTFGHGLPALQGLRIRGAITAGALLCHRPVKELVLATPLNYTGLSELCCLLDRSHHGDRLVTLIVRLTGALNASDVLAALGEVTPNLEQLALDQPGLDVLAHLPEHRHDSPQIIRHVHLVDDGDGTHLNANRIEYWRHHLVT